MIIEKTKLPGVLTIQPTLYQDERGYFFELHHHEKWLEQELNVTFVQDNFSFSKKDVLRGLHYQLKKPQGKLVTCITGTIFDVCVDIRVGSPTFGQSMSILLDAKTHKQIYIPPGFAHGFCVISDDAKIIYKCTSVYNPNADKGIFWNEPSFAISWPVKNPTLSQRDSKSPLLHSLSEKDLPRYA